MFGTYRPYEILEALGDPPDKRATVSAVLTYVRAPRSLGGVIGLAVRACRHSSVGPFYVIVFLLLLSLQLLSVFSLLLTLDVISPVLHLLLVLVLTLCMLQLTLLFSIELTLFL